MSLEVTDMILEDLKRELIGRRVSRREDLESLVKNSLKRSLREILKKKIIMKQIRFG